MNYTTQPPVKSAVWSRRNDYADEQGFLYNFTKHEQEIIQSVTNKVTLAELDKNDAEGGNKSLYYAYDAPSKADNDFNQAYYEQVTDKVFLLSVKEVADFIENRGVEWRKKPTMEAYNNNESDGGVDTSEYDDYWLRSASSTDYSYVYNVKDDRSISYNSADNCSTGIVPALYIKSGITIFTSGEGTKSSPYVISSEANNMGNIENSNQTERKQTTDSDVVEEKAIDFQDKLFEIMVRKMLGLKRSQEVTNIHLNSIEKLFISNKFIFNIDDIRRFNGNRLYFKESYVERYSDMDSYEDMAIETFSDLQYFSNLKKLVITKDAYDYDGNGDGNTILEVDEILEEINNLPNANNLEELHVLTTTYGFSSDYRIDKLPELSDLKNLRILDLSSNNIKDISTISSLTNLEMLNLSGNDIENIAPLNNLTNLVELYLDDNNIASIDALTDLTKLMIFSIESQFPALLSSAPHALSLEGMCNNLTNIQYLNLSSSTVKDITPIGNLQKLYVLDVTNSNISNYNNFLDTLYSLKNLEVFAHNGKLDESELDNIKYITNSTSGFYNKSLHPWNYNFLQREIMMGWGKWFDE